MQQRTMIIITVVLAVVVAFLTLAIIAGLYLTGGQTYKVPILKANLSKNTKVTSQNLGTREFEEQPDENVIKSQKEIIGKVTTKNLKAGSKVKQGDLRDKFKVLETRRSIPAGNRIKPNMVKQISTDSLPNNASGSIEDIKGKMVRKDLAEGSVVSTNDVYQSEKEVVVATQKLKANSLVRESQLKVVSRPTAPDDAVQKVSTVTGRALKKNIQAGQPIRDSDLFPKRQQLSYFIPLYRRAITLPVSNYNNVSYMLRPGDRIDLYIYLNQGISGGLGPNKGDLQLDAYPTLQKVADQAEVVTLNDVFTQEQIKQIESGGEDKKGGKFTYQEMTLAVTQSEAEKINLVRGMQQSGKENIRFFVILRPKLAKSKYGNRSMNMLDIFDRSLGRKHRQIGERIMNNNYNAGEEQSRENVNSKDVTVVRGGDEEHIQVPRSR